MNKLTIDGAKFATEKDLHFFLKEKLFFPHYYGANPHALWDMLSSRWIPLPFTIEWNNIEQSKKKMGEKAVQNFLVVFKRAEEQMKDFKLIIN